MRFPSKKGILTSHFAEITPSPLPEALRQYLLSQLKWLANPWDLSCRESSECQGRNWMNKVCGSIPAPADMVDIPLFTWFYRSQVVSRIFSSNSRMSRYPQYLDGFVLLGAFFCRVDPMGFITIFSPPFGIFFVWNFFPSIMAMQIQVNNLLSSFFILRSLKLRNNAWSRFGGEWRLPRINRCAWHANPYLI